MADSSTTHIIDSRNSIEVSRSAHNSIICPSYQYGITNIVKCINVIFRNIGSIKYGCRGL